MARILLRQKFNEILDARLTQMAEDVEDTLKANARVDTGEMRRLTRAWARHGGQSGRNRGITVRIGVDYASIVDAIYGYGRSTQDDFNSGPTVIELVERGMQLRLRDSV